MDALVAQFVASFKRAISAEMDAMRRRLGPFEVPLKNGVEAPGEEGGAAYRFEIAAPNDKLVLQVECTLTYEGGEHLVTVVGIDRGAVTVCCERPIPLRHSWYTLVIYPWFLYEKLKDALDSLIDSTDFHVEHALMAFGKRPPRIEAMPAPAAFPDLNDSQRRAVELCRAGNLAFVWGPPGTGKTTTLGRIVTALRRQGLRVLVTSTTNAAVDQALVALARQDEARDDMDAGRIVRVGQAGGDTFGAGLTEVVERLHARTHDTLTRLRARRLEVRRQIDHCQAALDTLDAHARPAQRDLFDEQEPQTLTRWDIAPIFSETPADYLLTCPVAEQRRRLVRRKRLLEGLAAGYPDKIAALSAELRQGEAAVVRQAGVVLATMTNLYISGLLRPERFDAVVVEEAGMAVLPTLFYCACLAASKVVMVGDPKQLPPIVQSRSAYVHKAMGRSIFEVTVPDPHHSDVVVMLDTQYRMHPAIGDLVSDLFYEGRLKHGPIIRDRDAIAAKAPFPGAPLMVVDTGARATCATPDEGFSRYNEISAHACVDLAGQALRDGIASVAVITPYVEQARLIRRLLSAARVDTQRVQCQTVHRFQGNERDLVILDTVDAPPLAPGVLLSGAHPGSASKNLLNVSISRARGKLIIVSAVSYFAAHARAGLINEILRRAMARGGAVPLP
ncbi:MAG: AAA family ATPase [Candidatus Hydrogenedentes bacterium]|nr:AAA family ATPase [Candidatus Hydrogenedentota bacterium]